MVNIEIGQKNYSLTEIINWVQINIICINTS